MEEQISTTPNPEEDKHELRREVLDFLKLVAWFLIIFLAMRTWVVEGYEVQGPSMEPNLHTNERILVFKLPHVLSQWRIFSGIDAVSPGDIVVFDSPDSPGKRYVKRVIAVGPKGDPATVGAQPSGASAQDGVEIIFDRGEVFVNNQKVDEPYLTPQSREASERKQPLTIGASEYYVLGDNRSVSKDSRSFDAIHDRAVIGTAVLRFWPPSKISLLE